MARSDLLAIPGIGRTFVADFARIQLFAISDLAGQDPERLYTQLCLANQAVGHKTSRNYLYVLRMAVYYADGGRNPALLRWNAWKD